MYDILKNLEKQFEIQKQIKLATDHLNCITSGIETLLQTVATLEKKVDSLIAEKDTTPKPAPRGDRLGVFRKDANEMSVINKDSKKSQGE